MNVGLNPAKILELENVLNQGLAAQHDFDSLAAAALDLLMDTGPELALLRLYGPDMRLIAATDGAEGAYKKKKVFTQALSEQRPQQEGDYWLLPLVAQAGVRALLLAKLHDESPENVVWLQWLAASLAQALSQAESRALRDDMQTRLTRIFAGLSVHQSLDEMLVLIQEYLFSNNEAELTLLRLQHDTAQVKLLASTWDAPFESYVASDFEQAIQQQTAFDFITADAVDSYSAAYLTWLKGQGIQRVAVWPMLVENRAAALLLFEKRSELPLSDGQRTAFLRVSERLSMLYHGRDLMSQAQATRSIADNLVLSSRLIATADSYGDMVQAAVYTIARNMTAVALTLFDAPLDTESRPTARVLVALGLPDGPLDDLPGDYLPLLADAGQLDNLWRGQPLVIEVSAKERFALATQGYEPYLGDQQVGWLAAFGLRAGDQVLGTLEVLHRTSYSLGSEEIDAYNTLADQIGVSVRSRQLLRQTEATLDETRLMYETNQQLIASQDTLELLCALRLIAPQASMIVHLSLEYDRQNKLADLVFRHVLRDDVEQVVYQPLGSEIGIEGLARIEALADRFGEPAFIEDHSALADDDLRLMAGQNQAGSMVVIPIRERGMLRDLVRVIFPQPQPFDERSRRLYRAVQSQMEIVLQTQRLLQAAQTSAVSLGQQVSVLRTLNELSTIITVATDEDQLLNQSIQALVLALGIDYGQVCTLDAALEHGEIVSEYPLQGHIGDQLAAQDLLVKVFPDLDQIRVVADVGSSELLTEEIRASLLQDKVSSFMLLPLLLRGRLTAYIRLDIYQADKSFSNEMKEIAQTILVQVLVGLQNIRLLRESNHRSEQLQMVSGFAQMLQASLDLDAVLGTLLNESREIIPTEWIQILLYDADADTLHEAALYLAQQQSANHISAYNGAITQLDNGSPITHVWKNQALLHVSDTSRAAWVLPVSAGALRSVVVLPLRTANKKLGIVCMGHSRPFVYSETDVIVLQQLTDHLATAIENATLYAKSRRGAYNEALVSGIAVRFQQQADIESMLQIAANDLGKALGARRARIRLGTGKYIGTMPPGGAEADEDARTN